MRLNRSNISFLYIFPPLSFPSAVMNSSTSSSVSVSSRPYIESLMSWAASSRLSTSEPPWPYLVQTESSRWLNSIRLAASTLLCFLDYRLSQHPIFLQQLQSQPTPLINYIHHIQFEMTCCEILIFQESTGQLITITAMNAFQTGQTMCNIYIFHCLWMESSTYQPYNSIGTLTVVNTTQIQQEQNLDYLQHLCTYIHTMNINPLWYQHQDPNNKAKLLQIMQMGINYSNNLSKVYQKTIDQQEKNVDDAQRANMSKVDQIRQQKRNYEKRKVQMKKMKLKYYDRKVKKMREKVRRKEDERDYSRSGRGDSPSQRSADYSYRYYVPGHPGDPTLGYPPSPHHPHHPQPYYPPHPHGHYQPPPPQHIHHDQSIHSHPSHNLPDPVKYQQQYYQQPPPPQYQQQPQVSHNPSGKASPQSPASKKFTNKLRVSIDKHKSDEEEDMEKSQIINKGEDLINKMTKGPQLEQKKEEKRPSIEISAPRNTSVSRSHKAKEPSSDSDIDFGALDMNSKRPEKRTSGEPDSPVKVPMQSSRPDVQIPAGSNDEIQQRHYESILNMKGLGDNSVNPNTKAKPLGSSKKIDEFGMSEIGIPKHLKLQSSKDIDFMESKMHKKGQDYSPTTAIKVHQQLGGQKQEQIKKQESDDDLDDILNMPQKSTMMKSNINKRGSSLKNNLAGKAALGKNSDKNVSFDNSQGEKGSKKATDEDIIDMKMQSNRIGGSNGGGVEPGADQVHGTLNRKSQGSSSVGGTVTGVIENLDIMKSNQGTSSSQPPQILFRGGLKAAPEGQKKEEKTIVSPPQIGKSVKGKLEEEKKQEEDDYYDDFEDLNLEESTHPAMRTQHQTSEVSAPEKKQIVPQNPYPRLSGEVFQPKSNRASQQFSDVVQQQAEDLDFIDGLPDNSKIGARPGTSSKHIDAPSIHIIDPKGSRIMPDMKTIDQFEYAQEDNVRVSGDGLLNLAGEMKSQNMDKKPSLLSLSNSRKPSGQQLMQRVEEEDAMSDSDMPQQIIEKSKMNTHSKDQAMKGILSLIRQVQKPPVKQKKPQYADNKLNALLVKNSSKTRVEDVKGKQNWQSVLENLDQQYQKLQEQLQRRKNGSAQIDIRLTDAQKSQIHAQKAQKYQQQQAKKQKIQDPMNLDVYAPPKKQEAEDWDDLNYSQSKLYKSKMNKPPSRKGSSDSAKQMDVIPEVTQSITFSNLKPNSPPAEPKDNKYSMIYKKQDSKVNTSGIRRDIAEGKNAYDHDDPLNALIRENKNLLQDNKVVEEQEDQFDH